MHSHLLMAREGGCDADYRERMLALDPNNCDANRGLLLSQSGRSDAPCYCTVPVRHLAYDRNPL